ncbi:hypothetical protein ACIQVK_15805 [Streptomyces sp. NPDC090493]|uniref:hypothetical protein n=1 Tax=Streptomyces sp. NPDC090493 TaxID=3365964 RepID=UPI0037F9EDF5
MREPERYRDFLDGIVLDWLTLIGDHLVEAGVVDREHASALATLTLAAFRGLLLVLVATGDRDRTSAAARALAGALVTTRP